MPRRSKNGRNSDITRVHFRQRFATAASSNVVSVGLQPSAIGVLAQIATSFELYRFRKLRMIAYPPEPATIDGPWAACYIPDAVVSNPNAINSVLEVVDSVYQAGGSSTVGYAMTVPQTHVVNGKRLAGQLDWYKATADAADPELETQGRIMAYTTGATQAINLLIEGVCEFKNPIDSNLALRRLKDLAKEEVREEVLAEMKSSISPPASGSCLRKVKP